MDRWLDSWRKEERDINTYTYTWCDNLIPGIVAACRWGVESGKLVYSSTFGRVPTCVYMSHRPKESFVPEQQRKYT
jgi:hypothetical protein